MGNIEHALRAYYFAGQYATDNKMLLTVSDKILHIAEKGHPKDKAQTMTEMMAWATRIKKIIAQVSSTDLTIWDPIVSSDSQIAELRILLNEKLVGDLDYGPANLQLKDVSAAALMEFLAQPQMNRNGILKVIGKPTGERREASGGGSMTYGRFRIFLNPTEEAIWVCFLPFPKGLEKPIKEDLLPNQTSDRTR
jgi:hypothetical protein